MRLLTTTTLISATAATTKRRRQRLITSVQTSMTASLGSHQPLPLWSPPHSRAYHPVYQCEQGHLASGALAGCKGANTNSHGRNGREQRVPSARQGLPCCCGCGVWRYPMEPHFFRRICRLE